MNKKQYYPEIDILKGFGILFVVFGHVLSQYTQQLVGLWKTVYNFLYVFHMPLFFFASGLLSAHLVGFSTIKEKGIAIRGKFLRLMVPYFAIGAIFIPINILMAGVKRNAFDISTLWTILIGNNPEGELWFLYVLFVFSVVTILFINERNILGALAATLMISCIAPYMKPALTSIGLGFSLYQLFPFMLGVYLGRNYDGFRRFMLSRKAFIPIILSLVFLVLYYAIPGLRFLRILAAMLMICILYTLSLRMIPRHTEKEHGVVRMLSVVGRYSMDIYLVHHPILVAMRIVCGSNGVYPIPMWIFAVIGTVISVGGSMAISFYLLRRVNLLSLCILGMKTTDNKER